MPNPLTDETSRKDACPPTALSFPGDGINKQRTAARAIPVRQFRALMLAALSGLALTAAACDSGNVPYGRESQITISAPKPQVWAVAPAINLSGQPSVDPLLQGDIVFQGLAQVKGVTALPINRTVEVFAALGIDRVESPEQAAIVCALLGADGLLVPTVTAFDPYQPPKMGASLSLFIKPGAFALQNNVDPRQLIRQAAPAAGGATPGFRGDVVQASGMYDASNGYTREAVLKYAYGRTDPLGPFGERAILVDSDKYAGFVYRQLTVKLLDTLFNMPADPATTQKSSLFPEGGPAGPQPFPSNRR